MMRTSLICLLVAGLCAGALAQTAADSSNFGTFTMQVNSNSPQTWYAHNAILYRSVGLAWENALVLQNAESLNRYYYPQLQKGESYVLHLLLSKQADARNAGEDYVDVYYVLGDSLPENLQMVDSDSNAFIFPNGKLNHTPVFARHHTAGFQLKRSAGNTAVSGEMTSTFDYPGIAEGSFDRISLQGNLYIPAVNLVAGSAGGLVAEGSRSDVNTKRNLALAGIISVLVAVGFAFR